MTGTVKRPVLRYHGGKFRIASWIIKQLPEHRIYVEPFGGAGSILMRKPRSYAEVYNDLDGDVVNVFRVLRDPASAELLRRLCELTPFSRREFRDSYEPATDPVERARRTILRTYMSHGTTGRRGNTTGFRAKAYRQNQTGAVDWATWPSAVPAMVDRLSGVTIEERDAKLLIAQQDSTDTLFYVDPPYPWSTRQAEMRWRSRQDKAYAVEMTDDQHRELAEQLTRVDGLVVLSGYPCDLYDRECYPGWRRVERGAIADRGKRTTEVLWFNFDVDGSRIGSPYTMPRGLFA